MAAKSKRDGVKCIKTDYNDNIDTSLVGLNKTYPVSSWSPLRLLIPVSIRQIVTALVI
jgi:hypothetical protein